MSALDSANYRYGAFSRDKTARVKAAIAQAGGHDEMAVDADIQDLYGYNGDFHANSVFVKL